MVNKHNVVQVRITCGLGSSVSEEFTVSIFRRHSEDGDSSDSSEQYPFQVILCLWKETMSVPFGLK